MNPQTGADLACASLVDEGVSVLFGHPGGAILPFYDALHRCSRLRHVLCRHEQAAAHAADGYARATGRTGVCVATSGPGATNLVTGLATALMDSVPLVALTGQVALPVLGTYAFQETDILGVTMPVTKHGFLVDAAPDVPAVIAEAFRLARSGRPGPVLVDLPKDVQAAPVGVGSAPIRILPNARPNPGRHGVRPDTAVRTAARWLSEAERPVVLAGRGVVVSRSTGALAELAARADLPVTTSLLGLDAFPASDARAIGMPGMHGTERANQALQEADLVVGLGVRFDDRVIGDPERFAPKARIAHFDVDATAIGRTIRVDLPVVGNLVHTLPMLARGVAHRRRPVWWARLRNWERAAEATPEPIARVGPLGAREAVRGLARRIVETGALVASDVGQHQMWLAQELADMAPGTHLTSGGLGTMGYALPAGLGAAVGTAERPVWVVAGDGGFQMNVQELATVAQERVPVRIAVVDNGYLGMVRQWQERFYGGRYSAVRLTGPDLVGLGEAYGIPARRIDRSEQLDAGLDFADAECGPVLLWLQVQAEENVYPIVPSGAALDEMVHAPEPVTR